METPSHIRLVAKILYAWWKSFVDALLNVSFYGDVKIYQHALILKMLSSCVVQTTSNTIL